ncbi:MAG: thioredoxin family protein [Enterococcus viikkiensis]|uniref:Thioredoxin family protein n=1 Tax=Enterococcus viikkiensis TaxID=930854 RepID=A0ABU3FSH0_9ENTE|nr:thioredoxin family protein [Enterococcus viikkiensis]MDT2828930.1 thioredoxin family protein [Enterococcus viikkiensis]
METLAAFQEAFKDEANTIVFISSETCSICHVDEPRARKLAQEFEIPYYHLDIMQEPELAGFFEVLTVPAVLVYHEGKEIARQARFIDFHSLEKLLQQLPKQSEEIDYQALFK